MAADAPSRPAGVRPCPPGRLRPRRGPGRPPAAGRDRPAADLRPHGRGVDHRRAVRPGDDAVQLLDALGWPGRLHHRPRHLDARADGHGQHQPRAGHRLPGLLAWHAAAAEQPQPDPLPRPAERRRHRPRPRRGGRRAGRGQPALGHPPVARPAQRPADRALAGRPVHRLGPHRRADRRRRDRPRRATADDQPDHPLARHAHARRAEPAVAARCRLRDPGRDDHGRRRRRPAAPDPALPRRERQRAALAPADLRRAERPPLGERPGQPAADGLHRPDRLLGRRDPPALLAGQHAAQLDARTQPAGGRELGRDDPRPPAGHRPARGQRHRRGADRRPRPRLAQPPRPAAPALRRHRPGHALRRHRRGALARRHTQPRPPRRRGVVRPQTVHHPPPRAHQRPGGDHPLHRPGHRRHDHAVHRGAGDPRLARGQYLLRRGDQLPGERAEHGRLVPRAQARRLRLDRHDDGPRRARGRRPRPAGQRLR